MIAPAPRVRWAYGLRLRVTDVAYPSGQAKLRPALGLRWGRWSFGTVDADDFVGGQVFQRESAVSYRWIDEPTRNVRTSLRLHNLSTREGFDALSSGRHTVRARVAASQQLSPVLTLVGEGTLDLLSRGDGITITAGVGRVLHASANRVIGASANATWASQTHWRSGYAAAATAQKLKAGIGDVSLGFNVRQKVSRDWAWSAGLSTSGPVGDVRTHVNSRVVTGLQLGIQRFGG